MRAASANVRLYLVVAREVSDEISTGRFQIGSRLPAERELAIKYKVSRPIVREAMIALQAMGLVDVRERSGAYVVALPDKR
jgi:GntR family transcriptional repressor for pyruvate dehydrogenase complex